MPTDVTAIHQTRFTAKDETAGVISSVKSGVKGVGDAVDSIKGKLGALAGAAAVGGFAALIKQAIDTADQLNDLSKRTGIAVETLGGLGYAAKQNGVDLETVAHGVQKLAKNMADAAGGNKEAAATFEAMGFKIRDAAGNLKPLNDSLFELADKFKSYADGPEKAALANEVFKKGGEALIPLLNEGGEKLRALVEEYQRYGGVTADTAARADQFNDTLEKVHLIQGALVRSVASALLPTLQALANIFVEIKGKGEGFGFVGTFITGIVKTLGVALISAYGAFQLVGKAIAALTLSAIEFIQGNYANAWRAVKEGFADATDTIGKTWDRAAAIVSADTATITVATEKVATTTAPIVKKAAAAVIDYGAILKRLIEPITAIIDALGKQNAALDAQLASLRNYGIETKETTVAVVEYELANGKLGQALLALALVYPQAAEALRAYILAQAGEKDQKQTLIELEKQYLDARRRSIEQLAGSVQDLDKEIQAERDRAAAIGLTRAELVNLHLAKEQELLDFMRTAEADDVEIKAVELRIAKYRELRGTIANTDQLQRTRDAWSEVLTNIADRGAQFITDFVEHGASAFKNLWSDFKKWALEALAKIAAQQIVIGIAGSLGGSAASAAGGLSQAGGGLGSVSNLASLFGGGSGTVAGIGGYLSSLGGALGAFGSTLGAGFSAGIATLSIAAEAGTAAIGGMASAMGAMAAVAIPVVGWIAAIGIALYAAFGNKGGGPKAGGFASSGDGVIVGGDNNRYFTPSQSDLEIKKATDQLLASYNGIVKALGGTAGKGGFALGFDTDPKGTADNRVSSGAFINGQQVYGARDLSVGRDDKQLQEALALEGKRVVLAALQASDLPDYLAKLLGSVKVDTASSEDIDRILATAQALKLAVTAFGQLGDQFSKLDPDQVQAVIDSFGGVDTFSKALQFLQDNFKTTAERTTETASELSAAFTQLGYAVPADHKAFLDLLASLDLTTEAGRSAYASITALAPAFIAVNGTADAAAQALQQQADANKKLLESAQQFYESNFFNDKGGLARQLAADWDKVHGAWTELGQQLLALGVDHIPTTNAAFRDLVESIDTSTDAGKALHDALILIAPTIFDLNKQVGALGDVADDTAAKLGRAIADLQDAASRAASLFSSIMQSIDSLSSDPSVGDYGAQQSLRLKLIAEQQAKYQALLAAEQGKDPYGALAVEYQRILAQLAGAAQVAAKDLAEFTTLSAQYGPALAQQLVGLEDWYAEQQGLLAGNVDALAALKAQFDQKWQDILNGVGGAVDATAAQLEKLRQSIRDYLKGLTLSELSPSSPLTKLEEAKKQYQDILKKAQAGDVGALGEVTKYADQYLKIAREVFASSPAYNAIFDLIYQQLAALAPAQHKTDAGIDPIERMSKALPVGSPLASQADLREIRDALAVLLGQVVSNTAKQPREHIAGAGGLALGLQRK